jgi:hypothetical protein
MSQESEYEVDLVTDEEGENGNREIPHDPQADAVYISALMMVKEMYPVFEGPLIPENVQEYCNTVLTSSQRFLYNLSKFIKESKFTTSVKLQKLKNFITGTTTEQYTQKDNELRQRIINYLDEQKCVYVLGCEELEHERGLYNERSWADYRLDCENLNLWRAVHIEDVSNIIHNAFMNHYAHMGAGDRGMPTKIGELLFLLELVFTPNGPSYEAAPSENYFMGMVRNLYSSVIKDRLELIDDVLNGDVDVKFDPSGEVSVIARPSVAKHYSGNFRPSEKFGPEIDPSKVREKYPSLGDMKAQIMADAKKRGLSAVDIIQNYDWKTKFGAAIEKDKEVQNELKRMIKSDESTSYSKSKREETITQRRGLGGGRRSKRNGKYHKKHRKSKKKRSHRRSRK